MTALSIITIAVAAALMLLVAVLHRGRSTRTRLLWLAAGALLVNTVMGKLLTTYNNLAVLDLVKHLVFLVMLASIMVLVMTFKRGEPFPRRAFVGVWALAGAVGLAECVLAVLMPTHADGTLYAYNHAEAGSSLLAFAYYAVYEAACVVTALACGYGGISALARTRQPAVAKVTLVLGTLAAATTIIHVGVGWLALLRDPGFDHFAVRHDLYLTSVILLFGALAVGGLRRLVVDNREAVMVRVGSEAVEPLWRKLTTLYPQVVVRMDEQGELVRFLRLLIESNDVVRMVREDPDPVLVEVADGRDTKDLRVTAELLVHLMGDAVVLPRPSWRARLLMRFRALLPDNEITQALVELYELRVALATFYDPPHPPKDDSAYDY